MTNRRPATCGACGVDLAPHMGRVWRDRTGVWRCTCLDSSACKRRLAPAKLTPAELAWAVRVAVQTGALEAPVEVLAARATGEAPAPAQKRKRRVEPVIVPVQLVLVYEEE